MRFISKNRIKDVNRILGNIKDAFPEGPARRLYRLKAAYSIMTELSSALGLEDALKTLINRIASYMGVEMVSIMFVDSDKNRLIMKIAKGLDEEVVRVAGAQIGEGVAGWVGRTGEPLLIKDITRDARFARRSSNQYYNNSLLSVPLKIRDEVIGVVNVNNKVSKDIFRYHDLELLKTIVDMSAMAIDNIRTREDMRRADSASSDMVANVSHELKTPLATIKEATLLMLEGAAGDVTEKQKRYLELSRHNVDRMVGIVNELLECTKFGRSGASIKRDLFNIADAAKNVLDSLSIVARQKGILLEGAIPDGKVEIWGDQDKLNEVISNLIENAIKYNRPKGKVGISLEEGEKSVTISVTDTGMGIPKDELDKIFDRFYRVGRNSREGIPGSGLGLSIVKDIVGMHQGDIKVESTPGNGSVFTVTLPKSLRK